VIVAWLSGAEAEAVVAKVFVTLPVDDGTTSRIAREDNENDFAIL
jgi:hypothetical protein